MQNAADTLVANGGIGINTTEATHRSTFIGAVLSTLPGATVLRRPARVELLARRDDTSMLPELELGRVYAWEELADAFGFKPAFFSVAGGMVPSDATNALLLITHPGGAKTFDYQDHWDGPDLIYTGRGKLGDQRRGDPRNLDVAENRRPLFVFERVGPRRLLFRGRAVNLHERSWPWLVARALPQLPRLLARQRRPGHQRKLRLPRTRLRLTMAYLAPFQRM